MLVLNRRQYEKILIGDDIEITVVQIKAGCVRIGITAPVETQVLRSELKDNKEDNEQAHAARQTDLRG